MRGSACASVNSATPAAITASTGYCDTDFEIVLIDIVVDHSTSVAVASSSNATHSAVVTIIMPTFNTG